jgi:putative membrane protein
MEYSLVKALLAFSAHIAVSSAMVVLFLFAYARVTPQEELRLIREGNVAATIALCGAMIGFVLALSRAITVSTWIGETALWGVIALIVQCLGHAVLSMMFPRLHEEIERGQVSAGILTGSIGIALGLINGASMTP